MTSRTSIASQLVIPLMSMTLFLGCYWLGYSRKGQNLGTVCGPPALIVQVPA